MTSFRKLMAANRGEIAIRIFRSAHELGIRTVAIYSHEDRFAPHRSKADEAYEVGKPGEPIRSYLEYRRHRRIGQVKRCRRDPSRVRLSVGERRFRPRLRRAGIAFVGPRPEVLDLLGDKVAARSWPARRASRSYPAAIIR